MMDYKFYSTDQIGQPLNLNILSGILPQERKINETTEAHKYEGGLIVIDSDIHHTKIEKQIFDQRSDRNKKTILLVDYSYETGLDEELYDQKVRQIASNGIDIKDVIFVFNRGAYKSWMDKHSKQILVIDLFAISAAIRHAIHNMPVSTNSVADRPKRINFLIGKPNKKSRMLIAESIHQNTDVKDPLVSILGMPDESNYDESFLQFLRNNQGPKDGAEIMQTSEGISSQGWSNDTSIYDQSSVSIVCETHETNDSIFLTEKIYRPIINRHPFVIRSSFRTIEYLQSVGFKTFNGLIDESYDADLEVSKQNCNTIVTRAQQLLTAVKEYPQKVQEIVDHNYKILIALAQLELARINQKIFELLK
jgi:hypothetical protein